MPIAIFIRPLIVVLLFLGILVSDSGTAQSNDGPPKIRQVIQEGHSGLVNAIAVDRNNRFIITGSRDNTVKLWDYESGDLLRSFTDHTSDVQSIAIDPRDRFFVSGSDDHFAKIRDLATGTLIHALDCKDNIRAVSLDGTGTLLAAGSFGGRIHIWDTVTGTLIKTLKEEKHYLKDLEMTPSGKHLFTVTEHKKTDKSAIHKWDLETGKVVKKMGRQTKEIWDIAMGRRGEFLYSTGFDGKVVIWKVKNGRKKKSFKANKDRIFSVAPSPDGSLVALGCTKGVVKLYNAKKGKFIRDYPGHHKRMNVNAVTFGAAGKQFLTTGEDSTIRIRNLETHQSDRVIKGYSFDTNQISVDFKKDVLVSASKDGKIRLWNLKTGRLLKTFDGFYAQIYKEKALQPTVRSIALDGQARFLAAGGFGSIVVWDLLTGKRIGEYRTDYGFTNSMNIDPGGNYIAYAWGDWIRMIELKTGRYVRDFKGHTTYAQKMVFHPQKKRLVTGDMHGNIKVWETDTGRLINTISDLGMDVKAMAVDDSGEYLVAGSLNSEIKIWRLETGELLRSYKEDSYIVSLAVDSKNDRIITGWTDRMIRIYGLKTSQKIATLEGHTDTVLGLAVAPDGNTLLSASYDNTIRFWNMDEKKQLAMAFAFEDASIVMTPEGYFDGTGNFKEYIKYIDDTYTVFTYKQFARRFYRPETVQLALSGKAIGDTATLEEVFKKFPAPFVEIVSPGRGAETEMDRVGINLKITEKGGGIGDIRLYVNDILVSNEAANETRSIAVTAPSGILSKSFDVALAPGENRIRAIAFNKDNSMGSQPAKITITARYDAGRPSLHVLAVGIDQYENDDLNLNYAAADAGLFCRAIEKSAAPLFKTVTTRLMTQPGETTKEAIRQGFKTLKTWIKAQDYFIFYNSSHGYVATFNNGDSKYFLIPSNVIFTDPDNLKKSALSQDELVSLVGAVPAQNKIIILDTCQAGEAGRVLQLAMAGARKTFTRALSTGTAMELLKMACGSSVLTASQSVEDAIEGFKGHGLFTYTLVEGLDCRADTNNDRFVTLSELKGFLERTVYMRSKSHFNQKQIPYINIGSLDLSVAACTGP